MTEWERVCKYEQAGSPNRLCPPPDRRPSLGPWNACHSLHINGSHASRSIHSYAFVKTTFPSSFPAEGVRLYKFTVWLL